MFGIGKLFGRVGSFLSGVSSYVLSEFKDFLQKESTKMVAKLLPYAREVVVVVAKDLAGADNEKKRKEAVNRLKEETIDWSQGFSKRLFNQAIEIAYENMIETCEKLEEKHKPKED